MKFALFSSFPNRSASNLKVLFLYSFLNSSTSFFIAFKVFASALLVLGAPSVSRRIMDGLEAIDFAEDFKVFFRISNAFLNARMNRVPPAWSAEKGDGCNTKLLQPGPEENYLIHIFN